MLPTIVVVAPAPFATAGVVEQLRKAGSLVLAAHLNDPLPPHAAGLVLAAKGPFEPGGTPVPRALEEAIEADLPILAIDWGMQALNAAYGGKAPRETPQHADNSEGIPSRHHVFLTLGGKVASVIGGAGVVAVTSRHRTGISEGDRGKGLMTSAY
ncbi:MAG: gamma-glutamyl-gamma-aminobutyrate hydrolase family protein, partial [Chloroflexi bacterium]|nr:gamma-glutamyl-gamma-aminobutyrate hydrolase family protein [Chloroflexota bacterium]